MTVDRRRNKYVDIHLVDVDVDILHESYWKVLTVLLEGEGKKVVLSIDKVAVVAMCCLVAAPTPLQICRLFDLETTLIITSWLDDNRPWTDEWTKISSPFKTLLVRVVGTWHHRIFLVGAIRTHFWFWHLNFHCDILQIFFLWASDFMLSKLMQQLLIVAW